MVEPGLDGIMYDDPEDKIILTNHSRPIGTVTTIDPATQPYLFQISSSRGRDPQGPILAAWFIAIGSSGFGGFPARFPRAAAGIVPRLPTCAREAH
jgi:hypothetical protein